MASLAEDRISHESDLEEAEMPLLFPQWVPIGDADIQDQWAQYWTSHPSIWPKNAQVQCSCTECMNEQAKTTSNLLLLYYTTERVREWEVSPSTIVDHQHKWMLITLSTSASGGSPLGMVMSITISGSSTTVDLSIHCHQNQGSKKLSTYDS
jgi:hypothetical protein